MKKYRKDCPSCRARNLEVFYEVKNAPVHSCLLFDNEKEAKEFPRDDVALGFCRACGFITNTAFNESHKQYSSVYEDQQCFSPTFNTFAKSLAQRLIEKYSLYNKTIIEIGCGKADFLTLMCELGGNKGVGIDPAVIPGRLDAKYRDKIELISDYYSKEYSYLKGDMILCRHTLEHVFDTGRFIETIKKTVNPGLNTIVFFEIPDSMRVLKERAFWDIYYEHCSYFTAGSVARLFRRFGFDMNDIWLDFGGQYLMIEAQNTQKPSYDEGHSLEESVEESAEVVDEFSKTCNLSVNEWRGRLKHFISGSKKIAIWGSGSKCVAFLTTLEVETGGITVVDINPHRHNRFIPGAGSRIMPPEYLTSFKPDVVIIMNSLYADEIKTALGKMSLAPEVFALK